MSLILYHSDATLNDTSERQTDIDRHTHKEAGRQAGRQEDRIFDVMKYMYCGFSQSSVEEDLINCYARAPPGKHLSVISAI